MTGHRARRQAAIEGAATTATRVRLFLAFNQLDGVARRVYVDRNAKGAPDRLRPRLREDVRPTLRQALAHAVKARAALLRGDLGAYDLELTRAHMALTTVQAEFRQPFMDDYRDLVEHGKRGGRPSKDAKTAEWMRRYDRMRATRRTLTAKECYEDIAADDLGDPARWRTVANRISEYRKRQK